MAEQLPVPPPTHLRAPIPPQPPASPLPTAASNLWAR